MKIKSLLPVAMVAATSLTVGSFVATPVAFAAENVVPDAALRGCINTFINTWATKYQPAAGNRSLTQAVSEEDVRLYVPKAGSLHCNDAGVKNLEGLQYAQGLVGLSVKNSVNSSRALSERVADFTPVTKISSLQILNLDRNNISSLPADMSGMTSLQTLYLEGNGSKTSEQQGSREKHNGIRGLSSLSALAQVPSLREINANYSDIASLNGLQQLTKLQTIKLSHNSITSLAPLANLVNLKDVRVDSNKLTDFSPLSKATKVTHLEIQNNNPTATAKKALNLNAFSAMPNLAYFDARGNNVTDVSGIAKATKLRTCYIENNAVADLSPIPDTVGTVTAFPQYPKPSAATWKSFNGKTYINVSKLKKVNGTPVTFSKVQVLGSVGVLARSAWAKSGTNIVLNTVYASQVRLFFDNGSRIDPARFVNEPAPKPSTDSKTSTFINAGSGAVVWKYTLNKETLSKNKDAFDVVGTSWMGSWIKQVVPAGDFDANGYDDMFAVAKDGKLWYYPAASDTVFRVKQQIGTGWAGFRTVLGGVDFDGDKCVDVLAIDAKGVMWMFPGTGKGQLGAKIKVGYGYANAKNLSITQKGFNGYPVIMGSVNDTLYAWQTNGYGQFVGKITYGTGWNKAILTSIGGDVTGDGVPDMWVVMQSGELRLYAPKNSSGAPFNIYTNLGSAWQNINLFMPTSKNARVLRAVFPDGFLRQYTLVKFAPGK